MIDFLIKWNMTIGIYSVLILNVLILIVNGCVYRNRIRGYKNLVGMLEDRINEILGE